VLIESGCVLTTAEEQRRKGQRIEARAGALKVAGLSPPDPRLLARTAQLLVNLGETRRAEAVLSRARGYAAPTYPPLTWAMIGARVNRGAQVDVQGAPTPGSPDARLVAVRGALAREGAAGILKVLRRMRASHVTSDPDLGWFAMLPRIQRQRSAVRLAERYASGRPAPGPVGAYVLGLLARWGGNRPLALRFLAQARAGHGDACSALSLQTDLLPAAFRRPGRTSPSECDPRLAPELPRAMATK
jgi:hypothetical protein